MKKSNRPSIFVFLRPTILLIAFLLLCFPRIANAEEEPVASPDVVFYEVMWAGSNHDSGDEWLVFKNTTGELIDLEGWFITRQNEEAKKFLLEGAIAPQGYYLVSRKTEEESILAIEADIVFSGLILNNTNLVLKLFNNNGVVADSLDMAEMTPVAGSNKVPKASMVRVEPFAEKLWETNEKQNNLDPTSEERATPQNSGAPHIVVGEIGQLLAVGLSQNIAIFLEYDGDFNKLQLLVNGVKKENILGEENNVLFTCMQQGLNELEIKVIDESGLYSKQIITTTCYKLADIVINEVMPMPGSDYNGDGKTDIYDEWLELYNPSGEEILLSGWQIYDSTSRYTFPEAKIGAHGYLVLFRSKSKISLNDDGDLLTLVSPADEAVSEISWDKAERGLAYGYFRGEYLWTTTATPNENNIFSAQLVEEENIEEEESDFEEEDQSDTVKRSTKKKATVYKAEKTGQKILSAALGGISLPHVNSDVGAGGTSYKEEVINRWGLGLVGVASLMVLARLFVNVIFSLL